MYEHFSLTSTQQNYCTWWLLYTRSTSRLELVHLDGSLETKCASLLLCCHPSLQAHHSSFVLKVGSLDVSQQSTCCSNVQVGISVLSYVPLHESLKLLELSQVERQGHHTKYLNLHFVELLVSFEAPGTQTRDLMCATGLRGLSLSEETTSQMAPQSRHFRLNQRCTIITRTPILGRKVLPPQGRHGSRHNAVPQERNEHNDGLPTTQRAALFFQSHGS